MAAAATPEPTSAGRCPVCGARDLEEILHWPAIPTGSGVFMPDRPSARAFPRGSFRLTACTGCGFLFNADHDPGLEPYSASYIETQSHSGRFGLFVEGLADTWIERHGLAGRHVLEVGCGAEASFLRLLRARGVGSGTGIDPACRPGEIVPGVQLVDGRFDGATAVAADALVCRHTLEHISDVHGFLAGTARWAERSPRAIHLYEVPDTTRILRETAFWDVYYEHCSYFTAETLGHAFARAGLRVERVELAYEGQYLLLEARVDPARPLVPVDAEDAARAAAEAHGFARRTRRAIEELEEGIGKLVSEGPVVLWQASSKAVSLLTHLDVADRIDGVVDINPEKRGLYLAGSGAPILAPVDLQQVQPRAIVLMNDVYLDEVRGIVAALGVEASVHAIGTLTS